MVHRLTCQAAVAACMAVATLVAAERATFILTSGERKSGPVVFHGEHHENLINGHLNLGDDSTGKEMTFPVDQVAVIQFVGGRPANAELEALPNDRSNVLVLKNGTTQRGQFINMIGGDTVRWKPDNGYQQDIPIRDVTRIYLNPESARTTFNIRGTRNNAPVAGTSGTVLEPGAIRVDAMQGWTSTGINVRAGDAVSFRATGRIGFGQGPTQTAGADGNDTLRSNNYPVAAMPVGGLIGRVGNSAPFPIGSNTQPIRMPANGTLLLGVNDDEISDNSGFFSVVVTR